MSDRHPVDWRLDEIRRMVKTAADLIEEKEARIAYLEQRIQYWQEAYNQACERIQRRKELLGDVQAWFAHQQHCPGWGRPLTDNVDCTCQLHDAFVRVRHLL